VNSAPPSSLGPAPTAGSRSSPWKRADAELQAIACWNTDLVFSLFNVVAPLRPIYDA
jgi:hypothetical protein